MEARYGCHKNYDYDIIGNFNSPMSILVVRVRAYPGGEKKKTFTFFWFAFRFFATSLFACCPEPILFTFFKSFFFITKKQYA